MDTSHTHRQSFFDYLSSENLFEFLPFDQQNHQKYLHSMPIISETLTCVNSISSKIMNGIFSLYGPFLMYSENKDVKMPTQVLDLTNSRLLLGAKFVVVRNKSAYELQFTEKKSQIKWVHALKSICIMSNFHERYSLIKSIGRGNFAKVFLLEAIGNGKFYAAKVFSKDVSETSEDSSRNKALILNEITLLRQLNHEGIPELHEIQETNTSIYLIMDHVQGKNLQELLKSGFSERYSNEEIISIFHSILKAIAYLHSQGIMHRDLKPANILIEKEGSVRVIDFGFATRIHQKDHILKICGSPGFMAPEIFKYSPQIPGSDYDERCDMFSAGSILFEMLFGRQAFNGCNDSQVMLLNKTSEALSGTFMTIKNELANQNSKINKDGLRLLLELMTADPTKRLSAIEALRHNYFNGINQDQMKFASFLSYYGFENVNNPNNENWSDFDSHYASIIHQHHHQFYYYSRSELSSRGPKALLHRMSGESILKHFDSVTSKIGHSPTLQKCGTQEIGPSPYGSFSDKNYPESLLGLQSLSKRKISESQRNNGTWRDLKQKGVGLTLENRIEEVNDESARDNKSKPSTNTLLSSQSLFKKKTTTKGLEAMKTYQEGAFEEEEEDDVELGDLGDEDCCVGNFIEDLKYQTVKIK